ncbi:MAG: hypothetical protein Q7T80_01935 [Methanoregula sp.]|nr:hypothetical protein [Methanoregula sp.]
MKCWRDLLHECIRNDCPMWMEDFESTDMPGENPIGLGESKCALVLKEKLKVYQSMLDIVDAIDTTEIDEEFFRQMAECTRERPRQSPARTSDAKKAVPAAKKQKKLPHS